MRPFHPSRPHAAGTQSHRPRPGDPDPPPIPMHPQLNPAAFPPHVPGFAATNPMAAVAAANPFLAMQLFSQAQQLQNLGYLAAAALQQQQQQQPFFPGGFTPNPNQFGTFPGQHAGFNGGGAFRPGGAGVGGLRPPRPMMAAAGNGCNSSGGGGVGAGSPRPMLNVVGKDRNSSGGNSGEVNHTKNKSDGISHFASENGERNSTTDQKARFNTGRDGRDGRQSGPSGGRGRGDGRDGRQSGPSGGRGRGDGRDGRQFGSSGGRGRGRHFNQGRGRGSNNWGEVKSNFTNNDSPTSGGHRSDSPASGGQRKRPPISYNTNEVKQWLEARKKNYPTCVNINKVNVYNCVILLHLSDFMSAWKERLLTADLIIQKLSQTQPDSQKKDEEAQMRRQELREVLAKQKELGFELPELPPGYLSETEDQANESKNKLKSQQRNCRFGNHTNKRRRYDRRDFQSKRPRVRKHTRRDDGAMVKIREPTLLQKLLSSDIKRDRHRLLHTFKFMVLNNFFKDWPDKPLQFPSVNVNQIELESNIAAEDLDDLQDAETTKGSSLDFKENGDKKDSSSSDGETGSKDDNEEEEEQGASAERRDEDGNEDANAEQFDAPEEDFSA